MGIDDFRLSIVDWKTVEVGVEEEVGRARVREMSLGSGFVELLSLTSLEAEGVAALLKKYEDLRPQLADACLVYLANRDGIDTIFTLDRRDFLVYRSTRRKAFRILP